MPGKLVLHRVLDGDDLVLFVADLGQRRVERGGLARAGRPGDQHHPVGLLDEPPQPLQLVALVEAADVEAELA